MSGVLVSEIFGGIATTMGVLVFLNLCKILVSARFYGSLCSVDFHTFTLQFPIPTLHSVAPELPVFVSSLENCQNFSKTRTPPGRLFTRREWGKNL